MQEFNVWVWDGGNQQWVVSYQGSDQWAALQHMNGYTAGYRYYEEWPPGQGGIGGPSAQASLAPGQQWDPWARQAVGTAIA